MRTETVRVFRFEELDDRAKEKAREWWRRTDDQSHEFEWAHGEALSALKALGFDVDRLAMAVSWCQGDGAGINGSWSQADVNEKAIADWPALESLAALMPDSCTAFKCKSYCRNGTDAHVTDAWTDDGDLDGPDDWEDADRFVSECESWAFKFVRDHLEWAASDEVVDETLIANEYEFSEDGERW